MYDGRDAMVDQTALTWDCLAVFATPIGLLQAAAREGALVRLSFLPQGSAPQRAVAQGGPCPLLSEAERQLHAYFAGQLRAFSLPLRPEGTPFQLDVWRVLGEIPYGCTCTYGELAARIGRPRAARAVGMALHVNPIAIIIPCHRVTGCNGKLTGYAGGLEKKAALLALEQGAADPFSSCHARQ